MHPGEVFGAETQFLRDQLAAGTPIEDALVALNAKTNGRLLPAIGAAKAALDISLKDARELIETSPAFNPEDAAAHAPYRRGFLDRLAPKILSARKP